MDCKKQCESGDSSDRLEDWGIKKLLTEMNWIHHCTDNDCVFKKLYNWVNESEIYDTTYRIGSTKCLC